jgi:hypothetical protein
LFYVSKEGQLLVEGLQLYCHCTDERLLLLEGTNKASVSLELLRNER